MDNRHVSLAELCHEVKVLCTKILEKTGFLLCIDSDSAHAVRSEVLSISAMMNMVDAVFTKGSVSPNSPFNALRAQSESLFKSVQEGRNYLKAASQSTAPDVKGSDLANIICQVPYLSPSTTLFQAVIEEIRKYRRGISESLKDAVATGRSVPEGIVNKPSRAASSGDPSFPVSGVATATPREHWEEQFQSSLNEAAGSEAKNLLKLQNRLFTRLWATIPRRVFALSQHLSEDICESTDRIDNNLLDTLSRRFASRYTMVFVGMQSSGKSMFLNAFLGKNLLPSHGTPTTTYPCRIRHVTGKVVPQLLLSRNLERGLACLRAFDWPRKYAGYTSNPPTWTGDDLPAKVEVSSLVKAWIRTRKITRENLSRFMVPSFSIPESVEGEDVIREWLQVINDITSLCRVFHLTFELFDFEDWALIECEFLDTPLAPTEGFCEVVDIPGVDYEHTWDDIIQEVIRAANAIVAVVSLQGFNFTSWEAPATLISRATNVSVAAIILTKADAAQDDEGSSDGETPEEILGNVFWKADTNSETKRGISSRCSVVGSRGALALLDLIKQQGTKPPFDIFRKMPYMGFLMGQRPSGFQDMYERWTLDDLIKECNERNLGANVQETLVELHRIINGGLNQQLFAETVGIEGGLELLQSLLALDNAAELASPAHPLSMINNVDILHQWAHLQKLLREDIECIISSFSPLTQAKVQFAAVDAISSTIGDVVSSPDGGHTIETIDSEALDDLISRIQQDFSRRQSAFSKDAMHQLLEKSRISLTKALAAMNESLETLESHPYQLVQKPWPVEPVTDPLALSLSLEDADVVKKERRSMQGREAFDAWRARLQHMLAPYFAVDREETSTLPRYLITLIAVMTFPVRYTLGVHQSLFVLDLDKLQRSLEKTRETYWKETFVRAFRQEVQSETSPILEAAHFAITFALAKSSVTTTPLEIPDGVRDSISRIQEAISVYLGFIRILSSRIKSQAS